MFFIGSDNEEYIDLEIVIDEQDEDLDDIEDEKQRYFIYYISSICNNIYNNAIIQLVIKLISQYESLDIQYHRAETFTVLNVVRLNSKVFMDNLK